MTLQSIYYVSQTIGVGAILLSLVAVWIQLRQGHRLARADLSNKFRLANQNLTLRVVDDPELSRAFRILVLERGRIEDEDTLTRMIGWFGAFSNLHSDALDASNKGLLDDWLFEEIENAWGQYLAIPVVWQWTLKIAKMRPATVTTDILLARWTMLRERALEHEESLRESSDGDDEEVEEAQKT